MRNSLKLFICLLICGTQVSAQNTFRNWSIKSDSKKRIALIIANNHYQNNGSLTYPIPTAKKLKQKLTELDFDVLEGHDLDRSQMRNIIKDYSTKLENYQFGMVFYMGHGFQIDGVNYLIPIDANPESKVDVGPESVTLEYLLYHMPFENIPKVIVLDACRNNPFDGKWSAESRSGIKEGFSELVAPINAEIYYTTQKNSTVRDDNPYMNYLIEEMKAGECLDEISRTVGRRILEYSKRSIPAKYGLLLDKVCFGKEPISINKRYLINSGTYVHSRYSGVTLKVEKSSEGLRIEEDWGPMMKFTRFFKPNVEKTYRMYDPIGNKSSTHLYSPSPNLIIYVNDKGVKSEFLMKE